MFSIRIVAAATLMLGAMSLGACSWLHSGSAPQPVPQPPPAPMQPIPPAPPPPEPQAAAKPVMTLSSDLAFGQGVALTRNGKIRLDKIVPVLKAAQGGKIVVSVYTDNAPVKKKGIADAADLSQKRADAVAGYLATKGIEPTSIAAQGQGEANPIAPNDTAKGRAQNRRVEILIAPPS